MTKQSQWRRHVEAWRKSELSQAEYCRIHGLNPKTFRPGRGVNYR